MNPKTYEITVHKTLGATPEQVFAAWSDPVVYDAVHDTHASNIDFRAGGRIEVAFFPDKEGGETFLLREIEAPKRLVFAWEGHEAESVTLKAEPAAGGARVSITQACGAEPGWIANCLDGWAWVLDSLEQYLETGSGLSHDAWSKRHRTHAIVSTAPRGTAE